jgi:hypothetical protein
MQTTTVRWRRQRTCVANGTGAVLQYIPAAFTEKKLGQELCVRQSAGGQENRAVARRASISDRTGNQLGESRRRCLWAVSWRVQRPRDCHDAVVAAGMLPRHRAAPLHIDQIGMGPGLACHIPSSSMLVTSLPDCFVSGFWKHLGGGIR